MLIICTVTEELVLISTDNLQSAGTERQTEEGAGDGAAVLPVPAGHGGGGPVGGGEDRDRALLLPG